MKQRRYLLDPASERARARRPRRPRPASLDGLTVALLDISRQRGRRFMAYLGASLAARGLTVRRYRKRTFARVASAALKQQIRTECDVVIEGLAD